MAKRDDITAELVRQLLDYDLETGILRWKMRTPDMFAETAQRTAIHNCNAWNAKNAGKQIVCLAQGYIKFAIFENGFLAHRVIWLWMTGEWPPDDIDHKNGNRSDNRWYNLRLATRSENNENRNGKGKGRSGFIGVLWDEHLKKYRARINKNGKSIYLGCFINPEDASRAYKIAKRGFHKFQPELRKDAISKPDTKPDNDGGA